MLVLTSNGVGAEHIHHFAVVGLLLIEGSVLKQTMLLNPCTVDDDLRFLIGSGELGRDMGNAALFLDR